MYKHVSVYKKNTAKRISRSERKRQQETYETHISRRVKVFARFCLVMGIKREETSNLKGSDGARDWPDGVGVNVISRNAWPAVACACFYRLKAQSFITVPCMDPADLARDQSHVQAIRTAAYSPGMAKTNDRETDV